MVAHLLRLKLTLLGNSLKRGPWFLVGQIIAVLYALSTLALLAVGMFAVRHISEEFWELAFVLGGSVVVMAWWFIPLMAFGLDSTLDPSRFATFSVPRGQLLLGLGVSGLIGIPGLITVCGFVIAAVVWLPSIAAFLAAAVCVVLALVTCVVGARALTTSLAPLLSSRRFREISGVLAMLPVLLFGPIFIQADRAARQGVDAVPEIVETLSWTPFGAVWAVPVDVWHGAWGRAAAHAAIAIVTVVVLVAVWDHFLQKALVTPTSVGARDAKRHLGAGLFGAYVTSPVRAVAARCLTYWLRDVRYIGSLAAVPVLPIALYLMSGGSSAVLLYILPPATAFLIGWSISADVAFDSTAFWLHLSSGISGKVDRAGRVLAVSILAAPILAVILLAVAWFTGGWTGLPTAIGLTAGVFLSAVGLSSVISARFIYAVPKPGDGPFSTPQGSATANLVVQGLAMLALVVLVLPEAILGIVAVKTASALAAWLTLAVGIVGGSLVCWLGISLGGRVYDERGPELMVELAKQG